MLDLSDTTLAGLLSRSGVTLFEWRVTNSMPLTAVGEGLVKLLGRQPLELLESGSSLRDLIHPDDQSHFESELWLGIGNDSTQVEHSAMRLRNSENGWTWVSTVTALVRDEEGEIERCVSSVTDISESHNALACLRESRDRLELVIEGTNLGIWDWNPQDDSVVFNATWAQLLGYELEEIEPSLEAWKSRVHPDDLESCYENLGKHIRGEVEFYQDVHRMRHKHGHWVHILDRGKIVERDENGNPIRFTGTHTDITPQRTAEMEATRANRAKSAFLARMSHEIRTPLNGVLGVLDILQDTRVDEEQDNYLQLIRGCGEHLLETINDVLDLSKIEAGEMRTEQCSFDVYQVLERVIELHKQILGEGDVAIHLEINEQVPQLIKADMHKLRQIIGNLMSNAVKFTREGKIEIRADFDRGSSNTGSLTIELEDTGMGIEDTSKIWDSFQQSDESITRTHGGTGLGLTICRELTAMLEGQISVTSQLGRGTCFRLQLPVEVVQQEDQARSNEEFLVSVPEKATPLRALIAEDNPVNLLVARRALEKLGLSVTMVTNGQLALEACKSEPFDVVFLDIHMPIMDGVDAAVAIRAASSSWACPYLVALSADVFMENQERCKLAGIQGFIYKPFDPLSLKNLLDEVRRTQVQEQPQARP
jgi:PAS domain S-box-containing protein